MHLASKQVGQGLARFAEVMLFTVHFTVHNPVITVCTNNQPAYYALAGW